MTSAAPTRAAGVPRPLDRALQSWEPTRVLRGTPDDAWTVLSEASSCVALTGAGLSTDSGVPDYRGRDAQRGTPMQFADFVGDAANRRRYWARAYQGWAAMGQATPNRGHVALANWEHGGWPTHLAGLITQNVDGLHPAAGSRRVVQLHGSIHQVSCLDCGGLTTRDDMQRRLAEANPGVVVQDWRGHPELRPDGDAVVEDWHDFVVPDCLACGGSLKPDVVFFGETVPRPRVDQARAWVDHCDALLVAGSSLSVMSGLRFVRQAAGRGVPVVIINHGATRGDDLATVRLDGSVSDLLEALVRH
ncbi:Sir2 family NAD-dependent protein deacetylase [Propionibacteriaceae bacterium G57]|uniref:Sir2 family NAD-dependent protein deacetylase n=1 Tax=Aestuariimicrobium sp. G57 TaxID=3418485 RepID=UPI003DA6E885